LLSVNRLNVHITSSEAPANGTASHGHTSISFRCSYYYIMLLGYIVAYATTL